MDNERLIFRGQHVLHVKPGTAELFELDGERLHRLGGFELWQMPSLLEISARAAWVCWRDANHEASWAWQPDTQPRLLAAHSGTRDLATVGFVETPAETLLAIAHGAELQLFDAKHMLVAAVELRHPHAWSCSRFTALAAGRVALTGNLFSDPRDMLVTVGVNDLLSDRLVLQRAIEEGQPIHDRAEKLIVGSGPDETAVVMRDPGDEEPPEDQGDETPDVWGLRGYYVCGLNGELVSTGSYAGPFEKHASIAATERVVAVELRDAVEVINRRGGNIRKIQGGLVALDPVNARVGALSATGNWRLESL